MNVNIDLDIGMDIDPAEGDGGLEEMVEGLEGLNNSGPGFHFGAKASKSKSKKLPGLGGLDLNSVQPLGNLGSSGGFKSRGSASYGKKIGFNDDELNELEA